MFEPLRQRARPYSELDKRWDVAQRLAVVEGKVHELESKKVAHADVSEKMA